MRTKKIPLKNKPCSTTGQSLTPLSIVHNQNMVYLPVRVIHLKHWEYSSPRSFGNQIRHAVMLMDLLNIPDMIISCHVGNISQSTFQTRKGHRTQVYSDDPSFGIGPSTPNTTARQFSNVWASFSTCLFIWLFY